MGDAASERFYDGHLVPPDLGAIEEEEREQEEWLASPEAVQEREASLAAYGSLSAGESEALLMSTFAEQLQALNSDPARYLSGAQLVRPLGETAATVKDGGDRALLDASIPVRTEDEGGDLAKVDVSLEATPRGYETANGLVDLSIPHSAGEEVEIGKDGLSISQVTAGEAPARRFGDKNAFYPEVLPDTDLLVAPTSSGVELFNLLRSGESPEALRFEFGLPEGAVLRPTGYGAVEAVRDGDVVALIAPPVATDAQGSDVPVELEASEEAIALHVAHRGGDFAYPILVDPIVEDWANNQNSWYHGNKLEALSNGAWVPASNNASISASACCWEGVNSGLLLNTQGNVFYGPKQFAQWSYSTANAKTYIKEAWITPFWRKDGACTSSAQPHDYAGMLWEPGETWNPLVANEAKKGALSLKGNGHAFVIGIGTGPPGVWISCPRYVYAGGVALWLDDDWGPVIQSISGLPAGGWFSDGQAMTLNVSSADEGLGINRVKVLNEGKGIIAEDTVGYCTGLYGARCPTQRNSQIAFTGDSFGEGIRGASVIATDPTGKTAESHFQVMVDRSNPQVELSGQLAQATDEAGPAEQPAGTGDELRLPTYKLTVKAEDGSTATSLTKRSGVKDVEIYVDGEEKAVPWSPLPSCPQTSCKMEETYTLALDGLAPGKHVLKVKATDFVGRAKLRDIEFEYFPATGMKDEYVMHYFPLPDGQGEESSEEHPARPELAVNVMNGNLVYRERDFDVRGAAVDLEAERYYNSQLPDSENTEWGDGWTLAQMPSLEPADTGGAPAPDQAELVGTSGTLEEGVELPEQAGGEAFDPAMQATITKKASGGYELVDETGESASTIAFDETGQAEALLTEGAAKVDFTYEGGELSEIEVEDPATFSADPSELEIPEPELVTAPAYQGHFGSNGSGDGQLNQANDVAVDAQGNLWVADRVNHRIQKFSPGGQFLAKFGSSGSGNGQFNRPTAIAIASNGDLLVADAGNSRVQRFSAAGAYLSKFGSKGTGNGQFAGAGPEGIAIDGAGSIWVSDTAGGRLQKFSSAGAFTKAIGSKGSGSGQLGEPAGLDFDPAGNAWVADWQNNRVSVFSNAGEFLSQFGTAGSGNGQFSHPYGVEVDAMGNAWVGDQGNHRIQQFDLAAQFVAKFGSLGTGDGQFGSLSIPSIAADSKGRLWATDGQRIQEWLVPVEKPAYLSAFGALGAGDGQLSSPADVAVGVDGNLWVADKSNNRIQQFSPSGQFLSKFGSTGSGDGQFARPAAIAVDRDGNLLVVDASNNRVQKFSPEGEFLSKFGSAGSGNGQFSSPEGIATDFEGNIWVADSANNRIQVFSEEGEFLKAIGSKGTGAGQLDKPMGLAVDPMGNVWATEWLNNRISVFDSSGQFLSHVGSAGSGNGQFSRPGGIEIDAHGNVWVADRLNARVQRFDLAGQYLGKFGSAGSGEGQFNFNYPNGVAADATGHIWVTDTTNNRIQQWMLGNYSMPTGSGIELTDGDPKVEVEAPGGLVSVAGGNAAGEHAYEHDGELLVSHEGPDGETGYEYDGEKLSKVTLANGTWAAISYDGFGRVTKVTVDLAGAPAAKTTEFEYSDNPRRTTVIPPDAPHLTYDIGDDGSVLKWWNTQKPPELDLAGTLYDNREQPGQLWAGDHWLEAQAESAEGIASIKVIANGNALVDERTCEQTPAPGIECEKEINEWVTSTDLHPQGRLDLEVLATDRLGATTGERFWVDIPPPPPPPAPGTPVPPKFRDIAEFREEYGLEVVFPVADEIELNERIFNLIKAWHEPGTPAGQVARASMSKWGVPLRPADIAELEYRQRYIEQAASLIPQWAQTHAPGSFAGFFVDDPAGGIIRIGFTSDQAQKVQALKEIKGLMAPDRIGTFQIAPANTLASLQGLATGIGSHMGGVATISRVSVSQKENIVEVGATDVSLAQSLIATWYGPMAPAHVYHRAVTTQPKDIRERLNGPLRAGDRIVDGQSECTLGFGAREPTDVKPNGETTSLYFALTAAHCFSLNHTVLRTGLNSKAEYDEISIGKVRRSGWTANQNGYGTDGEAIELKSPGIVPRWIQVDFGATQLIDGIIEPKENMMLCTTGVRSKTASCGRVGGYEVAIYGGQVMYQLYLHAAGPEGNSGGPVWDLMTGAAAGLTSSGPEGPAEWAETNITPLLPAWNAPDNSIPGILRAPGMGSLNLVGW